MSLSEAAVRRLLIRLVEFPYPQICRHFAALDILNEIQPTAPDEDFKELVRAFSTADDQNARRLLDIVKL
jgi:hypothetical protein